MQKKNRNILIGSIVVASVLGLCYGFVRCTALGHELWPPNYPPTMSDVPAFDAPGRLDQNFRSVDLFTKTNDDNPDVILITQSDRFL